MRIAYIILQYPKESETFVEAEINELRKRHHVGIFSIHGGSGKNTIYAKKSFNLLKLIKWILYLLPRSWRDIKYVPYALWISRQLNEYNYVHAYFSASTATIAYIAAKETGLPFSFSAHARDIFVRRESGSLRKDKIMRAKFVLVPSEWHRQYMTKRFGFADKYHVIPNSIDIKKFHPLRAKKKSQIIFVGRKNAEKKGFKYLEEARKLLSDCEFVVVSYDDEKHAATTEELIKKLNESKVFVMPSIIAKDNDSDGLPTTVMEAMACGLPVVATNIRALPEMAEGCGLLVEQKNPQALANAIKRVLNDEKLAKNLGRNGRKRATEKFDVVKNTKKLEDLMSK